MQYSPAASRCQMRFAKDGRSYCTSTTRMWVIWTWRRPCSHFRRLGLVFHSGWQYLQQQCKGDGAERRVASRCPPSRRTAAAPDPGTGLAGYAIGVVSVVQRLCGDPRIEGNSHCHCSSARTGSMSTTRRTSL